MNGGEVMAKQIEGVYDKLIEMCESRISRERLQGRFVAYHSEKRRHKY